jgi:hypothetical protein
MGCLVLASAVNAATRVSLESWVENDSDDLRTAIVAGLSHLALFTEAVPALPQANRYPEATE